MSRSQEKRWGRGPQSTSAVVVCPVSEESPTRARTTPPTTRRARPTIPATTLRRAHNAPADRATALADFVDVFLISHLSLSSGRVQSGASRRQLRPSAPLSVEPDRRGRCSDGRALGRLSYTWAVPKESATRPARSRPDTATNGPYRVLLERNCTLRHRSQFVFVVVLVGAGSAGGTVPAA